LVLSSHDDGHVNVMICIVPFSFSPHVQTAKHR
jgi:hypothetical protein